MTRSSSPGTIVRELDDETRELVALAVTIAVGNEAVMRDAIETAAKVVRPEWAEEAILQSYLFVGFPRALNAMRAWRKASRRTAPARDADPAADPAAWRARGEQTCATVYGPMYERLRVNIRHLHPALDDWMIEEGYGRVLGRPALDLKRRELCIAAVCAATEQDRQLHSHLHGALHAGASVAEIDGALEIACVQLDDKERKHITHLWSRIRGEG
jgi:4-carboxymuconolactone decarboxylase